MTEDRVRVVVVGGANVDVKACADVALVAGTSNPGSVTMTPGGVARNVAENLARLGRAVSLVAAVGTDAFGDDLLAATRDAGVDVDGVRRLLDCPTGTYIAVLGPDGELVVAVSDMVAVDALAPADLDPTLFAGAALAVLDGNLAPATFERALTLATDAGVDVVVDPVSGPKAARIGGLLGPAVRIVTPTRGELAALVGTDVPLPDAIALLHDRGVEVVWVRLGAEGSLLSGPDGTSRLEAAPLPGPVVDVTGAGDAMLAAFCHALLFGAAPVEAASLGHLAAALTITDRRTVRPDLIDELVRSKL